MVQPRRHARRKRAERRGGRGVAVGAQGQPRLHRRGVQSRAAAAEARAASGRRGRLEALSQARSGLALGIAGETRAQVLRDQRRRRRGGRILKRSKPAQSRARKPTLDAYAAKRDFNRTPEPAPKAASAAKTTAKLERPPERRAFVVQRHAARRLHYDLRLELEG